MNWSLVPSKFSGFNSDIFILPTLSSNARVCHVGFGTLGHTSPQRATLITGSRRHVLCLLSKESLSRTCTSDFQTRLLLMAFVGPPSPSAYFSRLPAVRRIPRYRTGYAAFSRKASLPGLLTKCYARQTVFFQTPFHQTP